MPRKNNEKQTEENLLTFKMTEKLRERFRYNINLRKYIQEESIKKFNECKEKYEDVYVLLPPRERLQVFNQLKNLQCYGEDEYTINRVKEVEIKDNLTEKDFHFLEYDFDSVLKSLDYCVDEIVKICEPIASKHECEK